MSLQERLEIIRSSPTPRGEEQAKFQIIAPILQNLDWDPYGPEVLYEHSVGGKGSGGRVDIALRSSGRVVALVEAKAPGSDLSSHVGQVLGYAFHEGVDICVLTTGLEWWLYLPRESGQPSDRRFAVLKIREDPVEQLLEDFNAFLSKEMLVNGQAERRAKAVRKAGLEAAKLNKEIPSIWKAMLSEPDDELVELLSKRIYERVNLRPTTPQVVAALQGSPIPSAAVPAEPPIAPPPQPPKLTEPKSRRQSVRPTGIELFGQRVKIGYHWEIVPTVVGKLYELHPEEFRRILEIRGKKRAYVSTSREGMHAARRVAGTEYFVDVHGSGEALRKRAERFLTHFGHDPSDLHIRYD